jgi:RNA polymerase sigma-70 factor (ECF subfamily)
LALRDRSQRASRPLAGVGAGELEAALQLLSEGERETLLLVAWERLSSAEVALVLELPQSTVRNRLARARKQLRGQLRSSDLFDQEA